MSAAAPSPVWRPVVDAVWQQRRNLGSLWPLTVIAALLVALPVVFALFVAPAFGAVTALGCWAAIVVILWMGLVRSVLLQNDPTLARLVPGHVRRLRAVLALGWLGGALAIAGPVVAVAISTPVVPVHTSFVWSALGGAALMLLLFAARWPLLWGPLWFASWALPSTAPWWRDRPGLRTALEAVAQVFVQQPFAVALLTMVAGACALPWLVQDGGAKHAKAYQARERRARMLRDPAALKRWHAIGPSWLCGLTHAPYRFWLERESAPERSSALQRALLPLGPSVHWSAQLGVVLFVALPVGSLVAWGMGRMPVAQAPAPVYFGLSVGMTMLAISALQQAPIALHQTRHEQALLVLLPGMPRGAVLNRGFARALGLHFALAWLLSTLVLVGLGAWLQVGGLAMLAMPVGALPLLGLLWRDWARQRAPSSGRAAALGLIAAGTGAAVFWLQSVVGPLLPLVPVAGAALAFAVWRWRRLGGLPQAWPTGRLV